jgi:hypothetical protein
MHRLPGLSHGNRKREDLIRRQKEKDEAWEKKRIELRKEYTKRLAGGEIRKPTRLERLTGIASGHPDRKDVQAAKRLLDKYRKEMELCKNRP